MKKLQGIENTNTDRGASAIKRCFYNKSFLCGFVMAAIIFVLTLVGFFAMPCDPAAIDVSQKFLPFSAEHIFGTDYLGRDILSRLMLASRVSIFVGFTATLFGLIVGTLIGAVGGYFGGIADSVITKIIDVQLSFPGILLALMLIAVFGTGLKITILALCIMSVPRFARIARSGFIKHRNAAFVMACKARGASDLRIMVRHILPNIAGDLIVTATLNFSLAVLSESGLSYLGLGVQPPLASFGRMLSESQRFILTNIGGLLVPAIALTLLVLGFNLIGDGIRDTSSSSEQRQMKDDKFSGRSEFANSHSELTDCHAEFISASSSESIQRVPLLEVKNLSVDFCGKDKEFVRAVDNVSLKISPGEFVAIVGESGCGKTLTASAIMNILPQSAKAMRGEILFESTNTAGGAAVNAQILSQTATVGGAASNAQTLSQTATVGGAAANTQTLSQTATAGGAAVNAQILSQTATVGGAAANLLSLPENERRKISGKEISMIFQDPTAALDPLTTVGRQIEEAAIVHGTPQSQAHEKAKKIMAKSGITDIERIYKSYPHELSGGQKQRVLIAAALINTPRLLIADEPTSALDATIQKEILQTILDLNKELGTSLLLITHDFSIVKKICSRLYVMYAGRIVESGGTEEILQNPLHPYTAALLKAVPSNVKKSEKLFTIHGAVPAPNERKNDQCNFFARCPAAHPECSKEAPKAFYNGTHFAECSFASVFLKGGANGK